MSVVPIEACPLCQLVRDLASDGALVPARPGVTLNRFQGEAERPRLVLQPERHVTRFGDLTDEEARNLGLAVRDTAAALEALPGVERCYVLSFNETPPGHLHVHLVPRFADDPHPHGPRLSDNRVPPSSESLDLSRILSRPIHAERAYTHSPLTDRVKRGLDLWNTRLSLYGLLRATLARTAPRRRSDVGETYVLMWLLVLTAAVAALAVWGPAAWLALPLSLIAAYRWLDLVAYTGRILLTTEQSPLQSVARSLVLFGLNLVELRLIKTTWVLADGHQLGAVWRGMLGTADDPRLSTWGASGAVGIGLATALVLGLAVAMVVGKIGDTFTDTTPAAG